MKKTSIKDYSLSIKFIDFLNTQSVIIIIFHPD